MIMCYMFYFAGIALRHVKKYLGVISKTISFPFSTSPDQFRGGQIKEKKFKFEKYDGKVMSYY